MLRKVKGIANNGRENVIMHGPKVSALSAFEKCALHGLMARQLTHSRRSDWLEVSWLALTGLRNRLSLLRVGM